MEKITVIVPNYNYGHFISESLSSIKKQTSTVRIIIIDDGSTDDSLEKINFFINNTKMNVKLLSHSKNRGISRTLNEAIQMVQTEYYMILSSDDYWAHKDVILDIERIIALEKPDVLIGDRIFQNDKRNFKYEDSLKSLVLTELKKETGNFKLRDNADYIKFIHYSRVYRTDFVRQNHINYPQNIYVGEDTIMKLNLFIQAKKISIYPVCFFYYRMNNPDNTVNNMEVNLNNRLKTFMKYVEIIPENLLIFLKDSIPKYLLVTTYIEKNLNNPDRFTQEVIPVVKTARERWRERVRNQIMIERPNIPNKFVMIKSDGTEVVNPTIEGLKVNFQGGDSSYVEIHEGSKFVNTMINVSFGSQIIIKKTSVLGINGVVFEAGGRSKDNSIIVDENFHVSAGGRIVVAGTDNARVKIGYDNLWSSGIVVRASDGHQIFDLDTLETTNFAQETIIGNNVWIGSQAVIMKGAKVLSGSVVGQSSVVTKQFEEENVVIVGNPARIVKHNIGWSQDYVWNFEKVQNGDTTKSKKILSVKKPISSSWKLAVENNERYVLECQSDSDSEKWQKFLLNNLLEQGEEYYFVLDYQTNVSTQFTLFLTNELNEIFRVPSFWTKRNERRKIIFPFIPVIEKIGTIALSASHFPKMSRVEIFDFRVEKVKK